MSSRCLMIDLGEEKYFTHENNYNELVEFASVCDAKISTVETREPILDLGTLAEAISETRFPSNKPKFQIVERKNRSAQKDRVRNFIKNKMNENKHLSLREIEQEFPDLTKGCLCNHFKFIRQEMKKEGQKIQKAGGGKYSLIT